MDLVMIVYAALVFFVLTPGILITIPVNGKKRVVAAVHAVIFGIVWGLSHKFIWQSFHTF
jgi:hypothetical protein